MSPLPPTYFSPCSLPFWPPDSQIKQLLVSFEDLGKDIQPSWSEQNDELRLRQEDVGKRTFHCADRCFVLAGSRYKPVGFSVFYDELCFWELHKIIKHYENHAFIFIFHTAGPYIVQECAERFYLHYSGHLPFQ